MQLRRDVYVGIGAIVAILVVIAFGAIGLFARMGPAIEHILEENDYSLEAAEDMLAVLAQVAQRAPTDAERQAFDEAFARAERNVTEAEEHPVLADLRRVREDALAGEPAARQAAVDALRRVVQINRDAMREADRAAQRFGTAGAWSAVFLGALGFGVGLIVIGSVRRRILEPLAELYDTALAAKRGERGRRCQVLQAPEELVFVMEGLNALFDERDRWHEAKLAKRSENQYADRITLLALLDDSADAVVVLDAEGEVITANRAGLERLDSDDGPDLRSALARVPAGDAVDGVAEARQLERASRWLVSLR